MIGLFLVPLVAAIIGIVMIVSAAREYTSDDINTRGLDKNQMRSKVMIGAVIPLTSAIYGLFCFTFMITKEIPEMTPYFWMCVAIIAIGALLSGVLMIKNIKNGEFFKDSGFSKTMLFGFAGYAVSTIGLLLFVLKARGIM